MSITTATTTERAPRRGSVAGRRYGAHPPARPPVLAAARPAARGARLARLAALAAVAVFAVACAGEPPAESAGGGAWSVTAWGRLYEVFPEAAPLVAGTAVVAHTHVTVLDGFAPLAEGSVEIVLRDGTGARGREQVFASGRPTRPGIFPVTLRPQAAGDYDLVVRVRSAAGTEELRGGRVRVGTAEAPGGVLRAPAPRGAAGGGEPIELLKEQQWQADFATAWVRQGSLPRSAAGLARVRPPAGGEATITAPVDGILAGRPWPHPGTAADTGDVLFAIVPRVAAEQSLPHLGAEVESLAAELAAARARLARLEELLAVEATSRREVEEARTRVEVTAARLDAARRDRDAARSLRDGRGRGAAGAHTVRAPLSGQVAAVTASPGAAVAAGEPLARMVRTDRVWLEVELPPAAARALAAAGPAGAVVEADEGPALTIPAADLRLVALAPEADAARGTVLALLETAAPGLVLGTTVRAEILLPDERQGIVVPATSLVDDGGVPVVYLQLAGERFVRQPVAVLLRQGGRVLVTGLVPGQRLVTRGGDAIRRATLMSSGEAHGHVH